MESLGSTGRGNSSQSSSECGSPSDRHTGRPTRPRAYRIRRDVRSMEGTLRFSSQTRGPPPRLSHPHPPLSLPFFFHPSFSSLGYGPSRSSFTTAPFQGEHAKGELVKQRPGVLGGAAVEGLGDRTQVDVSLRGSVRTNQS